MEFIMGAWNWLMSPQGALLFAFLYAFSEFLGSYSKVQSNSVYQLVFSLLKKLKAKMFPANPELKVIK